MKKIKLLNQWDKIRSSYWFVPVLMAVGAIGLSWHLQGIGHAVDRHLPLPDGIKNLLGSALDPLAEFLNDASVADTTQPCFLLKVSK